MSEIENQIGKVTYASWRNKQSGWHDSWGMFIKGKKSYYNKKDRKEICFISSFSVICVWDEPAIKIVNLNI